MTLNSTLIDNSQAISHAAILSALADPVLVVDGNSAITFANQAAEQFLGLSNRTLIGRPLSDLISHTSPVLDLAEQVRKAGYSASEYGIELEGPRFGRHLVQLDISRLGEGRELVICLKPQTIARKMEHQLTHRHAARSVSSMAAMLAHEIKNPLSGIKGAAQLLESTVDAQDQELTKLICTEANRIVSLVDHMEMFSDDRPIARQPVNIHEVLEHVRQLSLHGFARRMRIVESYDPSLPPVLGNHDLLVQVFLNLIKNAAECQTGGNGEILLATRYNQGVRLSVPGGGQRIDLPLTISIQDNGPGIPEDLKEHLFDPFVTSKTNGKGLGLALVAKIIGDHGGVIEFDSEPGRTAFRVMLPMSKDTAGEQQNA